MNRMRKRICAIWLAAAMIVSSLSGWSFRAASVSAEETTVETATETAEVTTKVVVAENEVGNVELEQKKVNETALTVRVKDNDAILAGGKADSVKVTAKIYYNDTVTQSMTHTIPLEQGKQEYSMDFENFGKFSVEVEYIKAEETVSASNAVTVGIVADEYNIALINGTFPAVLFSLSLWEGTEDKGNSLCITKGEEGNPIPTIAAFERLASWDWNELPENVYKLPTMYTWQYNAAFADWLDARSRMSAYVKDLYEISPDAVFHLYSTDNYIENMLILFVANQIPESQYDVVFLSDGSGTYLIHNTTYDGDMDGSLYAAIRADWLALKEKTREEGRFDSSWAKYAYNPTYQILQKYAAAVAEDDNVEWWVGRNTDTFTENENEEVLAKVKANSTQKSIATILSAVQAVGKTEEFRKLYHFDDDMFGEANENGKPVMMILGSRVTSEKNFKDYAKMVMSYYGDSYEYYYKGHPGSPTASYPSKQEELDELGITDVDSTIPAELILFFFPDISMCGYSSSTFLSVESEEMACGVFNMTKTAGLEQTTFDGSVFDYFASKIAATDAVYGSLCENKEQSYYLMEFNDTKEVEIAIYNADTGEFRYYKNIAEDGSEKQWSDAVMRNATVADIEPQDYTGSRIKPEVAVTFDGTELRKGVDYSVSYGSNVVAGQASVTVTGRGDYAAFGSIKKYFVINKVDNPLQVTCDDVAYGEEIKPNVVNPSLGNLTYEYKSRTAEDTEYSINKPTEPGEYTLRVTSDTTACYKGAEATADFAILQASPLPTTPPEETNTPVPTGTPAGTDTPASTGTPTVSPSATDTPADVASVPAESLKKGQKIKAGKNKYTVKVKAGGTVSLKYTGAVNKKNKKVSIPEKVTYKGVSYPVTEIAAKALANNKYVTKVTIGKSVTKIGNKAFYKCKNLKKVIIESKKITKIGSGAFKGINKKVRFTLPAAKKKDYKKKIEKAGNLRINN